MKLRTFTLRRFLWLRAWPQNPKPAKPRACIRHGFRSGHVYVDRCRPYVYHGPPCPGCLSGGRTEPGTKVDVKDRAQVPVAGPGRGELQVCATLVVPRFGSSGFAEGDFFMFSMLKSPFWGIFVTSSKIPGSRKSKGQVHRNRHQKQGKMPLKPEPSTGGSSTSAVKAWEMPR